MDSIAVFGLGFVGLPLSLTYTLYGVKVYGVDIDAEYIERLKKYETHVYENYRGKSIKDILKESIEKGLFIPTTSAEEAVKNSSSVIVTVGIPIDNGNLQMEIFENAIRTIGKNLKKGSIVLIRSTVPPGTTRDVALPIIEKESGLKCGSDFYLAYSSERIAEGNAFDEFQTMPVAVAGIDEVSTEKGKEILQIINKEVFIASKPEIVEISKLLENSSRDVNIAFVNEIVQLTQKMGIDTMEVIKVANTHKRVKLLTPGIGVGGHCIPYASKYIFYKSNALNIEMPLLHTARKINDEMPSRILSLIKDELNKRGKKLNGAKVVFIGIAMKDNSSDISESPAVKLMEEFEKEGARVFWFDSNVESNLKGKEYSVEDALKGADVIIVPVIQKDINLDINVVKDLVNKECIIFDARRIFDKKRVEFLGMVYLTL